MSNMDALFTIVCLVAVFAIFYGPWQGLCVDYARQAVFEQREKLFDLAADGHLNFDSVEYRELRDFLNKSIRFTHEFTIWRFSILARVLRRWNSKSLGPSVQSMVKSIPDDGTREAVKQIVHRAARATVLAMGARSLLVLIVAFVMYLAQRAGVGTMLRRLLRRFEREVQHEIELSPS